MSKARKVHHLSDIEITLYCDEELNNEEMLKVNAHMQSCESCKRLVVENQNFTGMLHMALENDLSTEIKEDCLSDMDISYYLEGNVSSPERIIIEGHLSKCGYCLDIIVETEKFLEKGVEEVSLYSNNKVMGFVKQRLRKDWSKALVGKFRTLIIKSPTLVKKTFEAIQDDMEAMINNTFTYPSPNFAPVFGESTVTVLSPFGKVRYPITFRWMPFDEANCYTISVDNTNWSFNTSDTSVRVSPKELRLDYGTEYMWELKVLKGEETIEDITGFFSIATNEEIKELSKIEKLLNSVKPETDRLMLWSGILEEKGFYMEAVEQYQKAYDLVPLDGIAYRIASCYDRLELEELRDEWNGKILSQDKE